MKSQNVIVIYTILYLFLNVCVCARARVLISTGGKKYYLSWETGNESRNKSTEMILGLVYKNLENSLNPTNVGLLGNRAMSEHWTNPKFGTSSHLSEVSKQLTLNKITSRLKIPYCLYHGCNYLCNDHV